MRENAFSRAASSALSYERVTVASGPAAEFCGDQHAWMRFIVIAEPESQFKQWLDHQARPAELVRAAAGRVAAGARAAAAAPAAACPDG